MLKHLFLFLSMLSCVQVTATEPETMVPEKSMYVALSFDDGPNNDTTPKVLDILEEFNVPASFFVIGQNINQSTAEQMKRAVSLGCEIQNHSYTHSPMSQLTSAEVSDEIKRTDALIEQYVNVRPTMFRPPFLNYNQSMHEIIEHTFICGIGCEDWVDSVSAEKRFNTLMSKVQDGDIILLHDFEKNDNTVAALRLLIPALKELGYTFITVSELFEKNNISPEAHSGYIYTNVLQKEAVQNR